MLTPEQRRAKKLQKMQEDTSCGVHITVYRIKDLSNHSNKFKVKGGEKSDFRFESMRELREGGRERLYFVSIIGGHECTAVPFDWLCVSVS